MRVSVTWGAKYLFLLVTVRGGLPHARGEQVRPFARCETRKHFESLPEKNHGEINPVNARAVDESTMMELIELLVKPAISPFVPMPEQEDMPGIPYQSDWEESAQEVRARRMLQTSCTEGDPFTITSSAFPSLEGCVSYSGSVSLADGSLAYNSSSAAVFSVSTSIVTTDGSAEITVWVVAAITDDGDSEFRCVSLENTTALPYPVEATWICDVDGDGEPEFPTSSQFSTSCGCSTSTVSTTDIGTESTTTTTTTDIGTETTNTTDIGIETTTTTDIGIETTTESGSATCDEGESFAITSTLLPDVAGCYTDTSIEANDEVFYTETGTVGPGQNIVQAFEFEVNASDVRWIVAFEASSDTTSVEENVPYCFSLDQAADVHPANVTSWFCFTNGPDEPDLISPEEFYITCGCSSTSTTQIASSTSETSTIGPSPSPVSTTLAPSATSRGIVPSASPTAASPTSTPTPANTCDGDFMVTSSAFPVLEGCFQATDDATSTANGEQIYTIVEGGPDEGTVVVTAAENDDLDPSLFWAMVIEGLSTSTADNKTYYCISKEGADEVHLADATWLCDLSGATSVVVDFVEVSDTDLAATCGCLGMTAAPSTIPGNDQDADFGHRSTTLSASVTVGVSFAAAVFHLVGL